MSRVSFDFDGTLTQPKVEAYCAELIKRGHDVIIVTYRFLKNAQDIVYFADTIGIPHSNIYLSQMASKVPYLSGCVFHLDDHQGTVSEINKSGVTVGINCRENNLWKIQCELILNKKIYKHKIPN